MRARGSRRRLSPPGTTTRVWSNGPCRGAQAGRAAGVPMAIAIFFPVCVLMLPFVIPFRELMRREQSLRKTEVTDAPSRHSSRAYGVRERRRIVAVRQIEPACRTAARGGAYTSASRPSDTSVANATAASRLRHMPSSICRVARLPIRSRLTYRGRPRSTLNSVLRHGRAHEPPPISRQSSEQNFPTRTRLDRRRR